MLLCALAAPCRPDEDTRRAARVRARMWAPHRLHLHLRGGAKKGVGRGEALPVPSASRVKFPKTPIRRGRESEREESSRSWQEHSRSLGAPDGKHTPGWPAAGKVRKRRGSDRQAPTASSDDEETLAGEESSVRFARLGAPDGKHTPAVSRSGARWPELFDSSTEVPARSVSPEGHLRAAAPLSSSKASQPSSRRVLFSDVPADAHSDLQAQASTQTKLPRPRPRRIPSTADNLAGEPGKRAHKKRKHSTPDPSSSEESGSGSEAGEEEDRTEEGGASGETRQEASSDSPSDTSHESIQDDSDYEDVMRMRRNKHAPVTGQVHGRPGGDYGRDTRTQTKTCGVGMLLESSAQSLFRVTKLAPGGAAAEHGGVVLDDLIHSVDSTSVRGMSLQQAAACICGPPGTFVTLEMLRGKKQIPVTVRLQRRPLHPSAEAPPSSTDARIADLVCDMAEAEVAVCVCTHTTVRVCLSPPAPAPLPVSCEVDHEVFAFINRWRSWWRSWARKRNGIGSGLSGRRCILMRRAYRTREGNSRGQHARMVTRRRRRQRTRMRVKDRQA